MNESQVFAQALKMATLAERCAYLDESCAGNPQLRADVEALLEVHAQDPSFLEPPAAASLLSPPRGQGLEVGGLGATLDVAPPESPGTAIGPYKLLELIGEGGMGTVWMAQQTEPVKRLVALKLIKAGMDSKQVLGRFEAERQALALMDHPNIAKVFDGGVVGKPAAQAREGESLAGSGRPYFVMELVKGQPITKYCDEHQLSPRQRLELFISVCQAVQHAHQKGIIHRDLKPSNVLVALYDGKPVPKVIDFGVAKAAGQQLTDRTLVTGFGAIVGTLEYMSPEQAEVNQLDIDTRSDIYSLGVLLYELLTGTTPLEHKRVKEQGVLELLRIIREEETPTLSHRLSSTEELPAIAANRGTEPSKLTKLVRGELDWIVMKALEKDRNRRYETANGFAMDVQRYLADEPVLACPPSVRYRLRKFARRNKAGLAIAGLILFFVVLLGGVVGWGMRDRAAREQEIALETARKLALTEDGIRQALDRGNKSRAELHAVLKVPAGMQQLLNQPARWELLIKTAQGELAQARRLAVRAEGDLAAEWTQAMDQLEQQLTGDQADYDLALRLEKVRLDAGTTIDGKSFDLAQAKRKYPLVRDAKGDAGVLAFNTAHAVWEYQRAFAEAGLPVEPGREQETAANVGKSGIKHQLLASLDDWAFLAFFNRENELCRRVLAVARLADPDPWRDQVRDLTVWRNQKAFKKLADQAQNDPERFRQLTPQMMELIGHVLLDKKAAEAWLRKAQGLHPADFWLNFSLGLSLKTDEAAIGFYRAALAVRPQSIAVYNNLGLVLSHQQGLAGAIDAFNKALAIDPQFAPTWKNLANALRANKDLSGAIDAHMKALAIDGQDADAWINFGATLYDSKDLPGAIDACKKALAIDPQNAKAWHNLGFILHESKDLPGAIDACKKALAIDPQNANTWANFGASLYKSKDLPGAIDALKKAVAIDPRNAKSWNYLGLALRDCKDPRGAIDAYKKGLAIDQQDANIWTNLALALEDSRDLPGAIDAHKKALAIDQQNATAWSNFGATLHESNDLPRAIDAYKKALAIDQHNALIWYNLATALRDSKDLPGAIDAFRKALAIDQHNARIWRNFGLVLASSKDLPGAIDAFKKALAVNDQDARTWYDLGITLGASKDLPGAIDAYKKALAIDPQDAQAWTNLGNALYASKDQPGAIDAYNRALAIDPDDVFALNVCAWLLTTCADAQLRDPARAVSLAKKAVELAPNNAQYRKILGVAFYRTGDWKAAITALEKSMELRKSGDSVAWFFLAMAHRQLGDRDKAHALYDQAVQRMDKIQPNNEELRRFRAEAAELLGVENNKKD